MIGLVKSTFFELTEPLDQKYFSRLTPYLLPDEKIFKIFKSLEFFAHFSNKRIIFTYSPKNISAPAHFEIEFLPYKNIQRFSFFGDDRLSSYNVELVVCDNLFLTFNFPKKSDALTFLSAISKFAL